MFFLGETAYYLLKAKNLKMSIVFKNKEWKLSWTRCEACMRDPVAGVAHEVCSALCTAVDRCHIKNCVNRHPYTVLNELYFWTLSIVWCLKN
jgi:hypothetical protein